MPELINQPMAVLFWYPTAIVKCNCVEGELAILVLSGIGNLSQCGKCHKMYRINRVETSPRGPKVIVDMILPSDPSKLM